MSRNHWVPWTADLSTAGDDHAQASMGSYHRLLFHLFFHELGVEQCKSNCQCVCAIFSLLMWLLQLQRRRPYIT